jgi:hypothetical protein
MTLLFCAEKLNFWKAVALGNRTPRRQKGRLLAAPKESKGGITSVLRRTDEGELVAPPFRKLDLGLRALALKDDSQARLLPRNEKDFGSKFPEIIESIVDLNVKGRHHRRRNCGFA